MDKFTFKLPSEDLREAYKIVDLVEDHAGLLSSQFVKLHSSGRNLRLQLTGLCLGESFLTLSEAIPPFTFFLDRRVLAAFLNTTQAQTISLNFQGSSLNLVAGRQKATFTAMDEISGYLSWKPKDGQSRSMKISAQFRKELGILGFYAPTTVAAERFSAVYLISRYGSLATDSYVIAGHLDSSLDCTFPLPVVLAKIAADHEKIEALTLDKNGAGACFPKGHIYQPISSVCQKEYPVNKTQEVIKAGLAMKPLLKIQAEKLVTGISHLQKFIFGSDVDVIVRCLPGQKENSLLLTMELARGMTQMALAGEFVDKAMNLQWPIAKIASWVTFAAALDPEGSIWCGRNPEIHCNILKIHKGSRSYILVVAEKD